MISFCVFFFANINTFGVSSEVKRSERIKRKEKSFPRPLVENEEESALVKLNSTSEHSVKGLQRQEIRSISGLCNFNFGPTVV